MDPASPRTTVVRVTAWSDAEKQAVSRLLAEYHAQTEAEKIAHGLRRTGPMPVAYQTEIDEPQTSFAASVVLLAMSETGPVGMVVARPDAAGVEVKRLWVDPTTRGSGTGTALLAAAADAGDGPVRLSVWEWRADAIGLYEARGFRRVPSWESRAQLVCLTR